MDFLPATRRSAASYPGNAPRWEGWRTVYWYLASSLERCTGLGTWTSRRYRTNTSAGRTGVPERLSGQPMRNALVLARRDQKKARWEQDHDDKRLASSTTALGRSDPLIRLETLPRSTVAGSGPGQATGGSAKGATGMACGGASVCGCVWLGRALR